MPADGAGGWGRRRVPRTCGARAAVRPRRAGQARVPLPVSPPVPVHATVARGWTFLHFILFFALGMEQARSHRRVQFTDRRPLDVTGPVLPHAAAIGDVDNDKVCPSCRSNII